MVFRQISCKKWFSFRCAKIEFTDEQNKTKKAIKSFLIEWKEVNIKINFEKTKADKINSKIP